MIEDLRVDNQPFDRLTALCQKMAQALDEAIIEERNAGLEDQDGEVRGIIFLANNHQSGIEMFNYDDTAAGLTDLLIHMKAMFASMGKQFGVMTDQGMILMDESDVH